jgi:isocitrate dehydrogenase
MAQKITTDADGTLSVPDEPIIPYIEGDGTGVDIWPAAQLVMDAAAKKHGKRIEWKEVLAGEKAFNETGDWLPEATVTTFRDYLIMMDELSRLGSTKPVIPGVMPITSLSSVRRLGEM